MTSAPSRQAIVVALSYTMLLLVGAATFVDPDVWHLMALARDALARGHLPLRDVFAYTPTVVPVVQHEWGSGFLLYALGTSGGVVALQAARGALIALIAIGAVRVARLRGATPGTLAALAVPAIVMSWIALTALRPQLLTLALLSVWLGCIESDRRGGRRWIAAVLVAHVVWLNLHAGFVVGMGFLALHAGEQAMRRRPFLHVVAILVVMFVLVGCNPYGSAYYEYLGHALTMPRPLIGEWKPIWSAHPVGFGVYTASVLIALAALLRGRRFATPGWPILATAAFLAARHERHVSIYALVWFAYVPAMVAALPIGARLQRRWDAPATPAVWASGAVLLTLATTAFVANRPWRLTVPGTTRNGAPMPYPVGPVRHLEEHRVRANVLVPFGVGAYVSWMRAPEIKVSLDSRYEVAYPPALLADHVAFFAAGPRWRELLERYPTDLVLVPRAAPVVALLRTETTWSIVYEDDAYLLFARPGLELPTRDRRGEHLVGTFP
jgi:hypothetical protein